jgi:hypothetical protein
MSQQMSTSIKYFCKKCKKIKSGKLVIVYQNDKPVQIEVLKEFKQTIKSGDETRETVFRARQLECNHFISLSTPGFNDANSETLNEFETQILRREIDKTMLGKIQAEVEQTILFHCEQYQTLLKIATKQKMQAKYAIQYLDQLKEKYSQSLSPEKKQDLDMRFAHFLEQRPTTNKVIEREISRTDKEASKQKAALEAVRAMLGKSGYKPKDLF